jgi:hypothetical protein
VGTDDATHVLVKVQENDYDKYNVVRHHGDVDGQKIFGISIMCPGMTAFYAAIHFINWPYSKIAARAGSLYTGNARWIDKDLTGVEWYDRTETKTAEKSTPLTVIKRQYMRQAITSAHIVHLRPEEIADEQVKDESGRVTYGTFKCPLACEILRRVQNMEGSEVVEVEMASWAAYVRLAPQWALKYVNMLLSHITNRGTMYKMLKREGVMAKQLQGWSNHNLSVIFELQVLQNRIDGEIDWEDERKKRKNFKPHIDITRTEVIDIATRIFRAALSEGKTPTTGKWEEYWALRWSKIPTGSFLSQYDIDKHYKKRFSVNANANKANVLASMPNRSFKYFYTRKPEIFASTSVKYEWGKLRALYGCDITSFLMSDFSMSDCDNCLPDYMPIGQSAEENKVRRRVNGLKGGIPVCYDYDDFNSQHSIESMKGVLIAYGAVYGPYLGREQLAALSWTIQSLGNMNVRCTQDKTEYRAAGTLFSGWRLTSFVNSVLNRVYLEAAGLKQKLLYTLHNGDDVFGIAESFKDVIDFMASANRLGLKAQTSKQNVGTVAEFLRIDLFAKDPTGAQYLTRACATVTHGRIESGETHSLDDEIKAVITRGDALIARGGNKTVAEQLIRRQIEVKCRIYESSAEVYDYVRGLHPLQGGMNLDGDLTPMRVIRVSVADVGEDLKLVMKGVNSYVDMVAGLMKVEPWRISNEQRERLAATTFKSNKMKLVAIPENRRNLISLKLVYRAHRHRFEIANLSKARLMGDAGILALGRSSMGLAKVAARARDPLAFISAIS